MTLDKIVKGPRAGRAKRTALVNQGRLAVGQKDPGKEYRWVNDRDDRIEQFKERGWEVELAENHRSNSRVNDGSKPGSAASINAGMGDVSILMSLPKDYYEEDKQLKAEQVAATEQTIKERALNSHKGKFELSRD